MLNLDGKGEIIATFKRNKNPMYVGLTDTIYDTENSHLGYMDPQPCYYCGRIFFDKWNLQRHHSVCKKKIYSLYNEIDPSEIILNHKDGSIQQYPREDIQEILYVSGIRGSGKSTYVANYIKLFKKVKPNHKIILVSNVKRDVAFSGIKGILKMKIDEDMVDNDELNLESFRTNSGGSLVIFDDANFTNKKIDQHLNILLSILLKHGRDHEDMDRDIYIICTSHMISNYGKTREIINECSSFTFFPQSGSPHHVEQFLKIHCGLAKSKINRLLKEVVNNSRWVTIYKHSPMYCLYERGVIMLKNI